MEGAGDTPEPVRLVVPEALDGARLDHAIAALHAPLSRNQVQRLILAERVTIDGAPARASTRVATGGVLIVRPLPAPVVPAAAPESIAFDVVYADDDIIVVDKPAGLVVHPGSGRPVGTLVNGLIQRFGALPGPPERPGIVHRIDRLTTGLLVVARSEVAYRRLVHDIAERRIERHYQALVWGVPEPPAGTIDGRVARSQRDRRRMAVSRQRGRAAVTHFETLEAFTFAALLGLQLETGRTHQIRVHLRWRGHPVIGDPEYGGRHAGLSMVPGPQKSRARELLEGLQRQALHAIRLALDHPVSGARLEWRSELPDDMQQCLRLLRGQRG